ncbi:hypothetical protein EJB05_18344, partial [Eragrostis curvula]
MVPMSKPPLTSIKDVVQHLILFLLLPRSSGTQPHLQPIGAGDPPHRHFPCLAAAVVDVVAVDHPKPA